MKEEKKSSSLAKMKANLQKLMKKRWVLPAVYLGLAAVVLSTFIWFQGTNEDATPNGNGSPDNNNSVGMDIGSPDAIPVTTTSEVFKMPVVNEADVKVIGYFFDFNASEEEQQNALVFYDNTYFQNKGIDIAMESGESFDVVAALSGTVVKAEKDALVGHVVHIEHDNKVVTVYQSLAGLEVEEGQTVKQGDVIGKAGRNLYNQDAGVHVHFEIRQDGVAVNPKDFFNQPITSITTSKVDETEEMELEKDDEVEEPSDDEEVEEENKDELQG